MKLTLLAYFLLMMLLAGVFAMATGVVLRRPSIILFGSLLSLLATAGFLATARRDDANPPSGSA